VPATWKRVGRCQVLEPATPTPLHSLHSSLRQVCIDSVVENFSGNTSEPTVEFSHPTSPLVSFENCLLAVLSTAAAAAGGPPHRLELFLISSYPKGPYYIHAGHMAPAKWCSTATLMHYVVHRSILHEKSVGDSLAAASARSANEW
jgi:hypothetical protein